MRNADCDSPIAMTFLTRRPTSGLMPLLAFTARPACEKMS